MTFYNENQTPPFESKFAQAYRGNGPVPILRDGIHPKCPKRKYKQPLQEFTFEFAPIHKQFTSRIWGQIKLLRRDGGYQIIFPGYTYFLFGREGEGVGVHNSILVWKRLARSSDCDKTGRFSFMLLFGILYQMSVSKFDSSIIRTQTNKEVRKILDET